MKSKLFTFLTGILIVFSFNSCSSSDDDNEPIEELPKIPQFEFSYTVSNDMLSVADITITYMGPDEIIKSEKLTANSWKKTFSGTQLPAKAGFIVHFSLKPEASLNKDKYTLSRKYSNILSVQQDKNVLLYKLLETSSEMDVNKDKLADYLQRATDEYAYEIKTNSDYVTTEIDWGL